MTKHLTKLLRSETNNLLYTNWLRNDNPKQLGWNWFRGMATESGWVGSIRLIGFIRLMILWFGFENLNIKIIILYCISSKK